MDAMSSVSDRNARLKLMKSFTDSSAAFQKCLNCGKRYELGDWKTAGCRHCQPAMPVEIIYDDSELADWRPDTLSSGIFRYSARLPSICHELSMGEGGTPLIPFHGYPSSDGIEVLIKDESQNPTWSHKDRLNLGIISAAIKNGVPGIVASSSGNHGASAAAYAARAGLPCVLFCVARPPAVMSFLEAYGQLVVTVPTTEDRWRGVDYMQRDYQYHPVTNYTDPPTNHPIGSEMYKSIAFEIFSDLGEMPAAVFVPVCYSELLFGIYKGFSDLHHAGVEGKIPKLFSCEAADGAPLYRSRGGEADHRTKSERKGSDAYSIVIYTGSLRGTIALDGMDGKALAVTDDEARAAQERLASNGIWSELSSAVALAGVTQARKHGMIEEGKVICINTSSGFKDIRVARPDARSPLTSSAYRIESGRFEDLDTILRDYGLV